MCPKLYGCVSVIHLRICDLIVAVVSVVVVADAVPLLITVIAAVVDPCADGTVCSAVESAGFGTIVGRRSTTSFRH